MGNIITVDFRGDTIFAAERDGYVLIAVKPICERLGISWPTQYARLKRDPLLSEGIATIAMPSPGGAQETTVLRLDLVNGWLFTIDESRVRDEEIRLRVLDYKRDCYRVLFEHFHGRHNAVPPREEPFRLPPEPTALRYVTETRQSFGTRAAQAMWFKLGLPTVPAMFEAVSRQPDLFVGDPPEAEVA